MFWRNCSCAAAISAEIMLGVLVVILRRDRIAGGLRVARELDVLFRDVGRISANLHVRAVRLVYARHRIVTLAVLVAPAHALVLTVSHDLPVCQPLRCGGSGRHASPKSLALTTRAARPQPRPRSSSRKSMRRLSPRVRFLLRSSNPLPRLYRGVAHLFLMRMAASLVASPVHRTVEASRPELANQLARSSGVVRSLHLRRRLSEVLLRGSLSAPKHLGSIPWAKPSRSCPTIQVLFFASGM